MPPLRRLRGERGQFLIGAIVFLAALMITFNAMVRFARAETKWTLKENRTTGAFHLAETGYNRAVWKLKESQATIDAILAGGTLAGYNNDQEYTDLAGGSYWVGITSGPNPSELTLTATGKGPVEYRRIRVVLKNLGGNLSTPLSGGDDKVELEGQAAVVWGPIHSLGRIKAEGAGDQYFPRKFSRERIDGRDTDASAPNTDSLEWWSFNESPGVPDPPVVDLAYYKGIAQSQGLYYTDKQTFTGLVDTDDTHVRYFEKDATFKGTMHFRGVMIVNGKLKMDGDGDAAYGCYTAAVPATAWMEYAKNTPSAGTGCGGGGGLGASDDGNYSNNAAAEGDKACVDQYPGDNGYHTAENFNFCTGCASHGSLGGANGNPIAFKGFIYARGKSEIEGSISIHGGIQMGSKKFKGEDALTIYYDDSLSIATSESTSGALTVLSWREEVPTSL